MIFQKQHGQFQIAGLCIQVLALIDVMHKQGAGWEVELSGLEPAPMWDPGTFKARTLAARPRRQAHIYGLLKHLKTVEKQINVSARI